ncbi:4'-phosphopantetheinyl transferase superfamily protein [Streptomyces sp. NPDC089919]|uniref:4'-phosphopantetheinyl transferase family protein n=1 Tax=Streptomyces sp. NPDC089919 TaxID=3155188 RepID=UPI003424DAC7
MDGVFAPMGEAGRLRSWSGAGLLVARRSDLHGTPWLGPAERVVAGVLPAGRRAEWLAGRLLAKRLLGEVTGLPPQRLAVLPRPDGSPYALLDGVPAPGVHLSVSHTERYVAAALAPVPVGVDLCETTSAGAVRRVAEHVFTAAERALVGAAGGGGPGDPDTAGAAALAGAWALKEAAVKADRGSVFGDAPRRVPLLGLCPPRLGGGRRAMVWRAEGVVLALVLVPAGPAGSASP